MSVIDEDLDFIEHSVSVKQLVLGNCEITDAGLDRIAKCKSLRFLRIYETAVTTNAIEGFRKRRPDVEIDFHERAHEESKPQRGPIIGGHVPIPMP